MITITMSFSIYSFSSPDRLAYDLASAIALASITSRRVLTASANTVGSLVTNVPAQSFLRLTSQSLRLSTDLFKAGLTIAPVIAGAVRECQDEVTGWTEEEWQKWLATFDDCKPYPSGP
jgi:hypothetical protein